MPAASTEDRAAAEVGTSAAARPEGGRFHAWLLIAVTAALYACACIDRQLLPLLVDPIRKDFGVSDASMGLLIGLGFSLFYSAASIPAGLMADRGGRRGLLVASSGIWSGMTMLGGFAASFGALFATRIGVGTAEGVVTPVSYSLIRERVPLSLRGRAFSIFSMAPYLGGSLALIVGGALLSAAASGAFAGIPLLGSAKPWQAVLIVIGFFSLILTPLPLLLRRDRPIAKKEGVPGAPGFGEAIRYMWAHRRTYAPLMIYTTLSTLVVFANGPWLPALVGRRFGMSLPEIGYTYGLVKLVAAPLGLLFVGFMLDRFAANGRAIGTFGIFTTIVTLIAFALVPFAPSAEATFAIKGVGLLFCGAYAAIGAIILAARTPVRLIGKVTVIYMLFQSVLGTGMGPLAAGFLSSSVLGGDPMAIGGGMLLTTIGIGAPALVGLLVLRRTLITQPLSQEPQA
ncbi:MFS transporter [Sphingomonas sp. G-3-2-10]|uniref:MFS transporter n=1 Tax=Sphingomonas sp. G-3-2-10 TaxID=2728838 RepID=UPI00146A0554|nr:MFS transporter [Sphingomonas sp. G-3-2-10]NML08164.1 MFS transporter [Sphingomonas sp. G-3-2-10]